MAAVPAKTEKNILQRQHDKKTLSSYGMFPGSLSNDPPPPKTSAHTIPAVQKTMRPRRSAVHHSHNSNLRSYVPEKL